MKKVLIFLVFAAAIAGLTYKVRSDAASEKLVKMRQAYVLGAARSKDYMQTYRLLFPEDLRNWVDQFQSGSSGEFSTLNADGVVVVDGRKRFVSAVQNTSTNAKVGEGNVYYLATNDVAMTQAQLVEQYHAIAEQNGDWLGYIARCVYAGGTSVPLMEIHKSAVGDAKRTGRTVCSRPLAKTAFGINIEEVVADYYRRANIESCDQSQECLNIKRSLGVAGSTFFDLDYSY